MKKRILALLLIFVMLCTMLTSCEVLKLVNNILGLFGGDDVTNKLSINLSLPDPNRCTTHIIELIPAIAPTCETPGASAGQYCKKCGAVIVAQTQLPATDHVYDSVDDKTCNNCDFEREISCQHISTETLEAKAPTCTSTGRTEGEQCVGCGKILSGFEIVQIVAHVYDDENDESCNICNYIRKLNCPHEVTEKLEGVKPTCSEEGLTEGVSCVHCGEIIVPQQMIECLPHVEGDWIVNTAPTDVSKGKRHTECVNCGAKLREAEMNTIPSSAVSGSYGLAFELNKDKNSYSLVGIGDCGVSEIVVPSYYNSKPVTKIADGAFLDNTAITGVTILDGVLTIGIGAFRGCTALVSVNIPESVTSIHDAAFYGCSRLQNIELPSGLTKIADFAFFGCESLMGGEIIPDGVTSIGDYAFYGCRGISNIALPYTLKSIGAHAFYDSYIMNITIPSSVESIGSHAFSRTMKIALSNTIRKIGYNAIPRGSEVKFDGTLKEWNGVVVDPRSKHFTVITTDGTFRQ